MNRNLRFMNLSLYNTFLVTIPLVYYRLNLAYKIMLLAKKTYQTNYLYLICFLSHFFPILRPMALL